jgi:hypothetical protein
MKRAVKLSGKRIETEKASFALIADIMSIYTGRMQKKASKVDSYWGQKVISYGIMSHVRGIISDGGTGYLLSDNLVFLPHKLNFSRKPVTIMLSDIERISDYRVLRLFGTRLNICLKSGKIEKFIIDRDSELYRKIKTL